MTDSHCCIISFIILNIVRTGGRWVGAWMHLCVLKPSVYRPKKVVTSIFLGNMIPMEVRNNTMTVMKNSLKIDEDFA